MEEARNLKYYYEQRGFNVDFYEGEDAVQKNVIASFGSPYFGNQYFEKA